MSELPQNTTTGDIGISSSLENSRWQNQSDPSAFERWHFDALSDDGREAVVIAFHNNYTFSPRYIRRQAHDNGVLPYNDQKFPAISFVYSVDGKAELFALNEFESNEMGTPYEGAGFFIGASSFGVKAASYGAGFKLEIDVLTARKCRIKAELEWLSIESDLTGADTGSGTRDAFWNIVAPRSDVSGRITLVGRRGIIRKVIHFRGTGYHDHFRSNHALSGTVSSRFWGRAHFIDSTVVFHHHEQKGANDVCSKLLLIRDGKIHERNVQGLEGTFAHDRYGPKLPEHLSFVSDDNIRLKVDPVRVIQSGFFEATILSEMTLMLPDGKPRKTVGVTELITSSRMRSRLFGWIADTRIGKNGKGPLF